MTAQKTISIVMPNHNHSKELETSLQAIAEQSVMPDEVLLIDDGSTDNSLDVVEFFKSKIKNLKLLKNEARQGVVKTVNRGIHAASGDYIILASADERILPDMCTQMKTALAQYPQGHLFVAKFTEWDATTGALSHGAQSELDLWFLKGTRNRWICAETFKSLLAQKPIRLSANAAMFSKHSLLEVGLFDENLKWHSDWFAIYAVALRYGFCAIPQILSWYRLSEQSYSVQGTKDTKVQQNIVLSLHDKLDQAEFRDIKQALMQAPSAMSPFMRASLIALIKRPRRYDRLFYILRWWVKEVLKGQRPRLWRRFLKTYLPKLRINFPEKISR